MLSAAKSAPPFALARTKAPCSTACVCSARPSALQDPSVPWVYIAARISASSVRAWSRMLRAQDATISGRVR